jgi:hypothetical protein
MPFLNPLFLIIMEISNCRKIAEAEGFCKVYGKFNTAFYLAKSMGEESLSIAIAISAKLVQQELLGALLNF